jgi:hypothetical protein
MSDAIKAKITELEVILRLEKGLFFAFQMLTTACLDSALCSLTDGGMASVGSVFSARASC